jgi:hypothetical protein
MRAASQEHGDRSRPGEHLERCYRKRVSLRWPAAGCGAARGADPEWLGRVSSSPVGVVRPAPSRAAGGVRSRAGRRCVMGKLLALKRRPKPGVEAPPPR